MIKTVHQFWHDGNPPPAIRKIMESWSDCDVRLWSMDDLGAFDGIAPLLDLASEIWGVNHRAVSDIARIAILYEHGGLYVDADCERVGDVWVSLDTAIGDDREVATVRPIRPRHLDHPRCCNGVIYAGLKRSEVLRATLRAMHARLDLCASQKRMAGRTVRPVDATGPMLLWFIQRMMGVPMIDSAFAAFRGVEAPDTEIVIHQGWRKYRATV